MIIPLRRAVMDAELTPASLDPVRAYAELLDSDVTIVPPGKGYQQVHSVCNSPRDSLQLWSRPHPSGVCEFFCVGTAPVDVHAMFAKIVDAEDRPKWDPYCVEHRLLRTFPAPEGMTHSLNYWLARYPTPLRKRDYVYERITQAMPREVANSPSIYLVVTTAVKYQGMHENPRIVRVSDSKTAYCLQEGPRHGGKPSCRFIYNGFDDPRGFIPKPIVNYFATNGVPTILQNLYEACSKQKDKR